MRVLLVSVNYRVPGCISHLFGNPAILLCRTRGFASPDYSGFARSENVLKLRSNRWTPRAELLDKKFTCTFNKKGALSSSEDECAPCVGNIPGAKNAYPISSATRLSFSGPVALRHQIALVLPFRRNLWFIYSKTPKKIATNFLCAKKYFFASAGE